MSAPFNDHMVEISMSTGREGVKRSSDRRISVALKSAQIVDFCGKSSGFADLKTQWIVDQL